MDEYIELSVEEWKEVIEKASSNNVAQFIIHCWANSQTASSGSVNAFKGIVVVSDEDRRNASTVIGNITIWVKQVTRKEGVCYLWNKENGTWNIGYNQTVNLRRALGVKGDF